MKKALLKPSIVTAFFLLSLIQTYAQNVFVSGTVLADEDSSPIAGVIVTNLATQKATQTNAAGYYSIEVAMGQKIGFALAGYVHQTKKITGTALLNIRLVSDSNDPENVVITAYGIARNKKELAYQVTEVKGAEIAATRRDNFLNALAGRVPGLSVTPTTGLPGASTQIMLRQNLSFLYGNNQPLFVVDGVPLNNSTLNSKSLIGTTSQAELVFSNRISDYTNRIADINPDDIENIVVLKSFDATAIYGSDGKSGAIIMNTKKGSLGKTNVYYDNAVILSELHRYPQIQTKYSRGFNGVSNNAAYSSAYGFNYFGPAYDEGTQLYDNLEHFFQRAISHQHNLSVEIGRASTSYRFSAGYLHAKGVVPNTGLKRINFRLSALSKINSKLTLTSSFAYINAVNDKVLRGQGSYLTSLITYPSDTDARDYIMTDGSRKMFRQVRYSDEIDNPFWNVNKNKNNDNTDHFTGMLNFSADAFKWLNLTTILGGDNFSTNGLHLNHPQSHYGSSTAGFISTYVQNYRNLNGVFRATFKKTIAEKYTNTLITGGYYESELIKISSQRGEQFFEPDFVSINNTQPLTRGALLLENLIIKVRTFANYTFGYNNLFYLTFLLNKEGTASVVHKLKYMRPFFSYGTVSGSFIFSELRPFKSVDWLNSGKLRLSYASANKGAVVSYPLDSNFSIQRLKPEYRRNLETGTELQLLNKRLSIDFTYYNTNTGDVIASYLSAIGNGIFITKYINGAEIKSKGVEVQVKATPVETKAVNWAVTLNFDKNNSTVKKMPPEAPVNKDYNAPMFRSVGSEYAVGQTLTNLTGYTFLKNNAGQLLINPTTGLPVIANSPGIIGDRNPDFKIGFINCITFFSKLNVSFNIDVRKGGDVLNGNEAMMTYMGTSKRTLDREQPRIIAGVLNDGLQNTADPTTNTIIINPYYSNGYYQLAFTDAEFIETVNWVRLQDITISYQLSDKIFKRKKVFSQASVHLTGTNLLLLTNYTGVDPNTNVLNASIISGIGGVGIDYGTVPTPRSIGIGVKLSF